MNVARAILLGALLVLSGCGRGNGLPSDLIRHLDQRGIKVTPVRVHAPASSRYGYVVTSHAPELVSALVTTFHLQRLEPGDGQWQMAVERAGGVTSVKEVWGIAGRPAAFKFQNGGQLEYFYLLVTEDGWLYLAGEYAYG